VVVSKEETQIPGEDGHKCFDAVSSKAKTLRIFTAEEAGSQHCQNDRLMSPFPSSMTGWRKY
jgi:hypothetical protein